MKRLLAIALCAAVFVAVPLSAKTEEEKERAKAEKRERSEAKKAEKSARSDAPAGAPTPTPAAGYDGFRYVRGRNIFDPNRRGLRLETPGSATVSSAPRGRSLALTGTMVTEGKALAFFGGSAAEGNRVVAVGSSVAGYKVASIEAAQVELDKDGKRIALNVGRQMTFDAGTGEPGAPAAPVVEPAAAPAAEATGVPALPGISGDKAEILRRMMERRAKEMGR